MNDWISAEDDIGNEYSYIGDTLYMNGIPLTDEEKKEVLKKRGPL